MQFMERGKFTHPEDKWRKKLLVSADFYLFWKSGRPVSSSADEFGVWQTRNMAAYLLNLAVYSET